MTLKTFKIIRICTSVLVFAFMAAGLYFANIFVALVGVIIGMLIIWISKYRIKEIIVDERIRSASEKAARSAFIVAVFVMGWTSVLIMIFNIRNYFPYLESVALLFAYITIFLIVIYTISYYYFINKTGGNDK